MPSSTLLHAFVVKLVAKDGRPTSNAELLAEDPEILPADVVAEKLL